MRRRLVVAAGVGVLSALSVIAAVLAVLLVFVGLLFGWLPGLRAAAMLWATCGASVAAVCVFAIRWLSMRVDHRVHTN